MKSEKFATAIKGILILLLMSLLGCSGEKGDTFTSESARKAARHFYTLYTQGNAQQYVEGMAGAESFPADYKEQMQNVIAQSAQELNRKGGVVRVEALSDTLFVADSTAYVYLDLLFTDSVHEQVGLPMVFQKGSWRMK